MSRNTLTALVAVSFALVCAASVWWFLRSPAPIVPTSPATTPDLSPAPAPAISPGAVTQVVPTTAASESPQASASGTPEIEAWEMQIDQVLRSNVSELEAAQILINTLPSLPEEGKVEAAHHISNLLSDKDYNRVLPILLNPNMPESVLSVFVTDLMNRADSTKLPALLEVAKISNHPFHEEAMSDLQIYLNQDYGTDWAKWKAAVDQYLAAAAAQ